MKKYQYKEITVTIKKGNISIIRDTLRNVKYKEDTKLIDVFNDLGEEGFELVTSNQLIIGESARSLTHKGQSETSVMYYYFKKEI